MIGASLLILMAAMGACSPAANGGSGEQITSGLVQVKGRVSGLQGMGLVLRVNDARDVPVFRDGELALIWLRSGDGFSVVVKQQPSGQTCEVTNGQGTVGKSQNETVRIRCGGEGDVVTPDDGQDDVTPDDGAGTPTRVVMLGDNFFTVQSERTRTVLQTLSGKTIEPFYQNSAEMTGSNATIPAQYATAADLAGGIRTVILDGGAFDALTGSCYTPTTAGCEAMIETEIFGAARTLLAEMKSEGVVNIVFVGYYNLEVAVMGMELNMTALVGYFADGTTGVEGMKAIVEEAGGVYVDPRALFEGSTSYVDSTNLGLPSAAGAEALAKLTWETMVATGTIP